MKPISTPLGRAAACLLIAGLVGCSGSGDTEGTTEPLVTVTTTPVVTEGPAPTTTEVDRDGPLDQVCPSTLTIQTGSLPGVVVGPLYSLLGPSPRVDATAQTVSGPLLRTDGSPAGIDLELRSGGPSVEFVDPSELLATDLGIDLAQVSTAVTLQLNGDATPLGIVSLSDRSDQALIVDPVTYPDASTIDDVRASGAEIRVYTDSPVIEYLTATGALDAAQISDGFDGEPAAFVLAGGELIQQGELTIDPVLYPTLPQWARPVDAIPLADAGWANADDMLVARPSDVESMRECLQRVVPLVQRSIAAYSADPVATDIVMSAAREQFAPLAPLAASLMDAGTAAAVDAGVFGDGSNGTVGDFDIAALDTFLPVAAAAFGVPAVAADRLVSNEFIDPDVSITTGR